MECSEPAVESFSAGDGFFGFLPSVWRFGRLAKMSLTGKLGRAVQVTRKDVPFRKCRDDPLCGC